MFIHWGPYSIAAGEWQGKKGSRDAHLLNEFRIPLIEYKKLAGTFNRRWGYDKNDHQWKSPEMVVRCLVDVASKGGNFLINIGPDGEGVVPAPSIERLHSLGGWLAVNDESIRGATASRIAGGADQGIVFQEINADGSEKNLDASGAPKSHDASLPRGWRSTSKPGCIYLHLFDRPGDGLFRLKGLTDQVKQVTMLADPQRRPLDFQQTDGGFSVSLPEGIWDKRTTVLKLEMVGSP